MITYLKSLEVFHDDSKLMFPRYSERNMNVLMTFLKEKGVDIVDFCVKNSFSSYCRYGYVLECVFHLHREKWRKKEITEP